MKDAPLARQWPPEGWQVKPDIILDGPEFDVPASGVIDWMWVPIPGNFTKDTWITSIQFQPLDPAVVHHIGMAQPSLWTGVLAEEVDDLWELWMRTADRFLDDDQLIERVFEAPPG